MKIKKNLHVLLSNEKEKLDKPNYKNFTICEKCRRNYLGKYDIKGNAITWRKISIDNCLCL
jgi:hypothetical protein